MYKSKRVYSLILAIIFCLTLSNPLLIHAQENAAIPYAYDTISKNYTKTFSDTLSYKSISPSVITASMLNGNQRTVSFNVKLTGSLQYDRLSGSYVSASSPVATLNYMGPVNLGLYNVSTSATDKGSYVTFTCSATVKGTAEVNGFITTINYGTVYYSFNQTK